jgi:hypothetical protein
MIKKVSLHQFSVHNLALSARLAAFGHQVELHDCLPEQNTVRQPTPTTPLTIPAAWRDLFFKTGANFDDLVVIEPVKAIIAGDLELPPVGQSAWVREIESQVSAEAAKQAENLLTVGGHIWQREYREIYLNEHSAARIAYNQTWRQVLAEVVTDEVLHRALNNLIDAATDTSDLRAITQPYLLATFGGWTRGKPDARDVLVNHVQELGVLLRPACDQTNCAYHPLTEFAWGNGWHFELMVAERTARILHADTANN